MLLLFWRQIEEAIAVGLPHNLMWYHTIDSPPRCLIGAEEGISIINPFMYPFSYSETAYAITNQVCNDITVYQGNVQIATESEGLKYIPWNQIPLHRGDSSEDISGLIEQSYNTTSGLLSNGITSVDANGDYLSVVTSGGLCWTSGSSFITYVSTSGVDTFISEGPTTYFAEGNSLRRKDGIPSDFTSWDKLYQFDADINDFWVSTVDGVDYVFVATASGAAMIQEDNVYDFSTLISGSKNIVSIRPELESTYDWGHLFLSSDYEYIHVINLFSKSIETSVSYGDKILLSLEYPRFYAK